MAEVLSNVETSRLSSPEKALLAFLEKVNHHSPQITPADFLPLYHEGWSDAQIYYAITVCALFHFYNRWVDATGVHAMSPEAHRQAGRRSAAHGYVRK